MLVGDRQNKEFSLLDLVYEHIGETPDQALPDSCGDFFTTFWKYHNSAGGNPQFFDKFSTKAGNLNFIPFMCFIQLLLGYCKKSDIHFLYFANTSSIGTVFISPRV